MSGIHKKPTREKENQPPKILPPLPPNQWQRQAEIHVVKNTNSPAPRPKFLAEPIPPLSPLRKETKLPTNPKLQPLGARALNIRGLTEDNPPRDAVVFGTKANQPRRPGAVHFVPPISALARTPKKTPSSKGKNSPKR